MLALFNGLSHRTTLSYFRFQRRYMARSVSLSELIPPRLPRVQPLRLGSTIELNEQEERLCTLLDECTKSLLESHPELSPIECRIAGGWVRDKLLGKDSDDIDIALSTIMGIAFAKLFVPFVEARGVEVRSVTEIPKNPEQSKHLETCKTHLMGLEIDFVNLRSEEYAVDSRIPTKVEFGTPLQDAMRRDITINALFYNVHTKLVEDHTGRGLDDLRNGIARTPLAPRETFLDDPLRVLRCIRFASRFGLQLEPSVFGAASEEEVREALVSKISRDRVGEEIDKMLKGRDPLHSLELIEDLGVHKEIFLLPPSFTPSQSPSPRRSSFIAAVILASFLTPEFSSPLPKIDSRLAAHAIGDLGTRRRLYLAAALTPFRDTTCPEKKKHVPTPEVVIREGIKLGNQNRYLSGVPLLLQAHQVLSRPSLDKFASPTTRLAIGLALRDKRVSNLLTDAHWSSSMLFSLVQDLIDMWDLDHDVIDLDRASEVIGMYNGLAEQVDALDLEGAIHAPPLLDGGDVCGILGAQPGVWMTAALAKVVEWQLEHPDGSKEDCREYLKAEATSGRLIVGDIKRRPEDSGGKKKKVKT